MGETFASRQSCGTTPVLYDLLNKSVSVRAIEGASCFRTVGGMLSGPQALPVWLILSLEY